MYKLMLKSHDMVVPFTKIAIVLLVAQLAEKYQSFLQAIALS